MEQQIIVPESNLDIDQVLADVLSNNRIPANGSILNVSRDPERTSDRYVETDDLAAIRHMNSRGWFVSSYNQVKAQQRNAHKQKYKAYVAVFKNSNIPALDGEGELSILTRNAKDGTKCHESHLGFFRFACANQLTVSNMLFQPVRIKHLGELPTKLDELIEKILDKGPEVFERIRQMKNVILTPDQQIDFATQALLLRFPEDKHIVDPKDVLKVNRTADQGSDLWRVTNRVQENLMKNTGVVLHTKDGKKTRKARGVSNIDLSFRINEGVWNLAEQLMN